MELNPKDSHPIQQEAKDVEKRMVCIDLELIESFENRLRIVIQDGLRNKIPAKAIIGILQTVSTSICMKILEG